MDLRALHRFPPAGWIPLQHRVDGSPWFTTADGHDAIRYDIQLSWLRWQLVGFAWIDAPVGTSLFQARASGGAQLLLSDEPMPLLRYGWVLLPRHWPHVEYAMTPEIDLSVPRGYKPPQVMALALPQEDASFDRPYFPPRYSSGMAQRSWIPCPHGHVEGAVLTKRCPECCPGEPDAHGWWTSTGKQAPAPPPRPDPADPAGALRPGPARRARGLRVRGRGREPHPA